MCVKHFLGFSCGHCSVPWIVKCPTTQADQSFPVCSFPAEHPHHQSTVCHPCFRVLWNAEVLNKENEHKKLHREGKCKCDTVFPDLHDAEVRPQYNWAQPETPSSLLHGQTHFGGPSNAEIMNAYINYLIKNSSDGIAVAYYSQQRPQSQEQYQSPGEWARQYVHDRPDQRLYYDHEGNIFLFDPDTTDNPFVEIPVGLRDIHELPPVPTSEENTRNEFWGAWTRNDFVKLDHEKLRYGNNHPSPPLRPYGHQFQYELQRNDVYAPGFGAAGPSNYPGNNNAPAFGVGTPFGGTSNLPVFVQTMRYRQEAEAARRAAQQLASSVSPHTPEDQIIQSPSTPGAPFRPRTERSQQRIPASSVPPPHIPPWQLRGPADWGVMQAQQPVFANRAYEGAVTYGIGSRYYPNSPAPSSSAFQPTRFPVTPTQPRNVRQSLVPASSSNIDALTQFENLNIGSGAPEDQNQQPNSRQGVMRVRGRSMRATHAHSSSNERIAEAMNAGNSSEDSSAPKVKLPAAGNAGEGSSTYVSAVSTTPNTRNIEYQDSERLSGIIQGISDDSEVFSALENAGNEATIPETASNTSIQPPSVVTAPSSPEITSPVIARRENGQ